MGPYQEIPFLRTFAVLFVSIFGVLEKIFLMDQFPPLSAAPPLHVPFSLGNPYLIFVNFLTILAEFFWTCSAESVSGKKLLACYLSPDICFPSIQN